MAKNIKRILALCMVLMLSVSMIANPALAKGTEARETGESHIEQREETDTEAQKTEDNKSKEQKTEESKTEESKTEESKTEENKTEESKTEESKTEESKTEESKTEKKKEENKSDSSSKEYIVINANGAHVKTISGTAGDHTWLVQGTYTERFSMSGNVLNYTIGKQSGSVTIPMPAGFENCTISDVSITCTWGGGVNSQDEQFDNAIINVTFSKVVTPGGDIVDITDPTEPVETEPVETKPVETEPVETEPVETEPVETESVETKPVETEPVETEPVETEPVETEPVDYEPVVRITKTAAKDTYKEGETISWTITVKNVSAYTAYNVAVSDALTGDNWSIAALAPGASQIFTATLENAPAGTIKNVAVVSWDDNDEIPDEDEPEEKKTDKDDEIVDVDEPVNYTPVLKIVKTADKAIYKEGETITWTITVHNISTYTAYDVVVSDELTGEAWTVAALEPNNAVIFTATLRNAPAGTIKNVAVVSWDDNDEIPNEDEPEEPKTTEDDDVVIVEEPVNYTPVLTILKTANKAVYETGEIINWSITVKNVSEYTAYDVVVTDELTGDRWTIAALAPGAQQNFTTKTLAETVGSVRNVAVVTWEDGDEIPDEEEPNEIKTTSDEELVGVNDPAPENYTPVLQIIKTAEKTTYKEGESVKWFITVKNVSEYTAYDVTVVDRLAKGYWIIDSLAPGAEKTFEAVMENVAAGSIKNVVVATWEDGDDIPDEEEPNEITETSDEEIVVVEEPVDYEPILTVIKTANKSSYKKGDTIKWTIKVKNVSAYTAYNVVINDELTGDTWTIDALEPGAEKTFKATTKNAKAGTIKNVVVVSWEDGDEIPDEEEPTEITETSDDETVKVKDPATPATPVPPANPDTPDTPDTPNTPEQPADETPAIPATADGELEIPDEEVPLADAPKTGDVSMIWIALSSLSAGGMMVLGKKREDDEE